MAGFGCPTAASTHTKARPAMLLPIPMSTIPATDGCGWQRPGFGAGGLIPTLDLGVRAALAGIAGCTTPGMDGADTAAALAADTALVAAIVSAMVSVVALAVRVAIALSADSAAAAVAARELSVDSTAVVAARVAVDTAADIAEAAVWGIENRTRLATETIIGVVFSTALAIGSLITSGEDLIEALFGGVGHLTTVALGVIGFVLWQRHRLVLALVSPEIAHTSGINVQRLNLYFLLVFALTIALGLRYLGPASSPSSTLISIRR